MRSRFKSSIISGFGSTLPALWIALMLLSCSGMGSLGGGMNPGGMGTGPVAAKPQDESDDSAANALGDSDDEVNPAWQQQQQPIARNDLGNTGNTEPMDPGLLSPSKTTDPSDHHDVVVLERVNAVCQMNGQYTYEVSALMIPYKKKHRPRWVRLLDNLWDDHGNVILNTGDYMNFKMPEEGTRRNGGWVYPFSYTVHSPAAPAWVFRKLVEKDDGPLDSLVLDTELPCDPVNCTASHWMSIPTQVWSPPSAPLCNRLSTQIPAVEEPENIPDPILAPAAGH